MRRNLVRYSELIERQRKQLFSFREAILIHLNFLKSGCLKNNDLFQLPQELLILVERALHKIHIETDKNNAEQYIYSLLLKEVDLFWSDQLSWAADKKEAIHLVRYAHKNPLHVFIHEMVELFDSGIDQIFNHIHDELESLSEDKNLKEILNESPKGPSSTWTYQINDNPFSVFNVFSLEGIGKTLILMLFKVFQILALLPLSALKRFVRRIGKKL